MAESDDDVVDDCAEFVPAVDVVDDLADEAAGPVFGDCEFEDDDSEPGD